MRLSYLVFLFILFFSSCGIPPQKIPEGYIRSPQQAEIELAKLEKDAATLKSSIIVSNYHWQNLNTILRQARYLLSHYKPTNIMLTKLSRMLDQAHFEKNAVTNSSIKGIVPSMLSEGYYDDCDDSYQPFLRYIPPSALKGKKMPLIVFLHGYSPAINIINWAYLPSNLVQFAEKYGFALAAPFGRGNTDYQGIGENDVIRVIDEMQKRYNIDKQKIIISGISMGGMGTFTIASHHPDKFAAALVISGRGDYYFWQNIQSNDIPLYKRTLINAEFPVTLLPNLKYMPIMCIHGSADSIIPVAEARHIAEIMRKNNLDFEYIEIENGDHWIYDDVFKREDVCQWLLARKSKIPQNYKFLTYHQKDAFCYGVKLTPLRPLYKPAELTFAIQGEKLLLQTKGISSLVICRELLPAFLQNLKPEITGNAKITIIDKPGEIPFTSPAGPIKNAFLTPFAFVCTAHPSDTNGMTYFEQRCHEWYRYAKAYPRKLYEINKDYTKLSQYNIFVFGEPEQSAIAREILKNSPIKIQNNSYIVGKKSFPREGNGLFMVIPNPWNPQKLSVLQCGIPWGEKLPENHKYDFLPDYIIYSKEYEADGCNRSLCAGFFTSEWQLPEEE